MPKFLIERNIPNAGSMTPEQLKAASTTSNGALAELNGEGRNVQWVHSYVVDDAIYCVYHASDPEAVRDHARRSGFPADRVIEVRTIIDPATGE